MRKLLKILALVVGSLALAIGGFTVWGYLPVPEFEPVAYTPVPPTHWPTHGWRHSTPEEQGMSSEALLAMFEAYEEAAQDDPETYIDSMTVIRNGTIVAEYYGNPLYQPGELHVVHSVTKTVVGALIGIAIDKGLIESLDVSVVALFPERTIDNLDARKKSLTIRDLLSMQTGLHSRDSYLYGHENLYALQHSDDWLQFALDLPMAAEPGERFDYSNISTFLLSAILTKATGMDTLEFAHINLFEPLGIEDVKWEWNDDGQAIAWARMWLKPHDMAKIGLLYQQKGQWDGRRVVPGWWVRASLRPAAYPQNAVDILNADMSKNGEKSNENWFAQRFFRPFADGYGYQWWLDRDGAYTALGTGGQYISVAPDKGVVFVATSKCSGLAQFLPARLFFNHVLPAVESEVPLPPDYVGAAAIAAFAVPPPRTDQAIPVPDLPAAGARVAGVTWVMEENPLNVNDLRLEFAPGRDTAVLAYTARESWDVEFEIGLDGVRRLTPTNDSTFAAKGAWISPTTFRAEVEIVGYSTFDVWEFTFEDDGITVRERGVGGDFTYRGEPGRLAQVHN